MLVNKQYGLINLPIPIGMGNVLTTVSDRKLPHTSDNITIDYYTSDITSAQDYYAFGMLMPGRNFSSNSYKFGFNGKLNDDEVFGATGFFQDYGMRMYDTRVCRFWGVDPLTKKYPMLTPFQFASNSPIAMIDIDGLEGIWKLNDAELKMGVFGKYEPDYSTPEIKNPAAAQLINGVVNIACGVVGTLGLIGYIGGTAGVGGAVGGVVALDITLSQIGIGIAQVIDGSVALSKSTDPKMPKGDNLVGLISYGINSPYAGIINLGTDLATNLPGEGIAFIWNSWKSVIKTPNLSNSINALDVTFTTLGFIQETYDVSTDIDFSTISDFKVTVENKTEEDVTTGMKKTTVTANYSYSIGEGKNKKDYNFSKNYSKIETKQE